MTTPATSTLESLPTEQRLQLKQSATILQRRWQGQLNVETIERFMAESLDMLAPNANVKTWLPVLVERLTNDRLRALVRLETPRTDLDPSVLFLCVHNAGRSQMAAGFMRHLAGPRVDVFSGGSEPASQLNQAAVAAMAEQGIDISRELPQPWADEVVRAADVIVTMGCGDACPVYPGKRYVDWELDDPAGKPVEEVRPIRDEIERRVRVLLGELDVEPVTDWSHAPRHPLRRPRQPVCLEAVLRERDRVERETGLDPTTSCLGTDELVSVMARAWGGERTSCRQGVVYPAPVRSAWLGKGYGLLPGGPGNRNGSRTVTAPYALSPARSSLNTTVHPADSAARMMSASQNETCHSRLPAIAFDTRSASTDTTGRSVSRSTILAASASASGRASLRVVTT